MAEQLPLDFNVSATQRHRRAIKANDEVAQLDLFASWTWSPNIDIHLDGPDQAVASIAGKDPDRAHDWLSGMVGGNITVHKPRKVAFPTSYLDRFLHLRPPAQVTLDAASTAVARAIWARKLDLKPIRVEREGRRLTGTTYRRWPTGFSMKDIPWSAVHACVHLDIPLEVDDKAQNLFAKKLTLAGTKVATSGIAGSAVTITTRRPELVERLNLPGLAYDGIKNTGQYRLPILTAEPLLRQDVIEVPAPVADAIRKATRPIRPLTGLPESFPWKLYDFQAADAGRALRILETTGGVLLAGDMGSGKALSLEMPVKTPSGWRPIADLKVGDQVLGRDGKPHDVTGYYPQGEKELFDVKLSDGTVIRCCDDHLWQVRTPADRQNRRPGTVRALSEFRHDLRATRGWMYSLPRVDALEYEDDFDPIVAPYILGVILGDGRMEGSGQTPQFCGVDEQIADEVRALLPPGMELVEKVPAYEVRRWSLKAVKGVRANVVSRELRRLGLAGKLSYEKFVPREYLDTGSPAQRLALLQGLMDTDGTPHNKSNGALFVSTSRQLCEDVRELVLGLGGVAKVTVKVAEGVTYEYRGQQRPKRPAWQVSVNLPPHVVPFRLGRKRARYTPVARGLDRKIVAVTPVGRGEAACISVSASDRLFLTAGLAPTRNTTVSLSIAEHLDLFPMLVVCPLSAFSTWARQLGEMGRNYYMATESPAKSWAAIEENEYEAVIISFDRLGAFLELVERKQFKSVIADEVQRIRTPGSKRSRAIRQIAGSIPYRMGLSGTPLTNTVADVLPLGAFLVPGEWKPRANEKDLEDLYPGEPTESLAEHLGSIMVRRRMDQVGRPMPKRNDHRIYIQLTPEQRRALADLEAEAEAAKAEGAFDDNSGRMHAFARLQKMRQIINSPSAAGVSGPNPKVNAAIDLAKDFLDKGRKGVIFCADRTTFRDIGKRLDEEGVGWVGIWGSTSPADRIENEKMFHRGDPAPNGHPTDVVVCTIQAGAESWSASPTGTWLITTAYVYAPSTLAQMSARVHRMNSDLDGPEIEILFLHAQGGGEKGSLDDRMVEILEVKKHLFAQVVDRQVHTDTTKVHYSMGDLVYLMTGERDEKRDALEKDAKKAVAREKARTEHAKKSLYKHKRNNADLLDDTGDIAVTLEDYRAKHPELEDVDDLDALLDAADHDEDLDGTE